MATQAASIKTTAVTRLSTGISGLDEVLEGGLPAGHLYLIQGDPGTGKTTMALQFLLDGLHHGETVLYVTLSETERELREVAAAHGWSLDGVHIRELTPAEEVLAPESQYTIFHPAEIELADTTKAILEFVDQTSPKRVVIDSLSELRMLARDALRYRREILWIKEFFLKRQCTVLMLDDRTADVSDLQLQSIAHGVLSFETLPREYGSRRRRLEIVKMRGARFRDGYHDYAIKTGGLEVYSRISGDGDEFGTVCRPERILSGIAGLDSLFGGGLFRGTSTLITGPAGSGKSTLVTQYAFTLAKQGGRAALYIFDESIQTLQGRSTGLGMHLDPLMKSGHLMIRQVNPAELSPGEFANYVRSAVEKQEVNLVVIDSLNGYFNAMPGENFLSLHMHELLSFLNQNRVTTLMVLAQHGFIGQSTSPPVDVSYLADTVCLLRFFEAQGEVKQAISVLKNRSGDHERTIREFRLREGNILVGDPLSDFNGVLTGVPVFTGQEKLMNGSNHGPKDHS